jgi:hypothetical protein
MPSPGAPRRAALEESRVTEEPADSSGSAFWTVKTVPLRLMEVVRSYSFSVISPSGP